MLQRQLSHLNGRKLDHRQRETGSDHRPVAYKSNHFSAASLLSRSDVVSFQFFRDPAGPCLYVTVPIPRGPISSDSLHVCDVFVTVDTRYNAGTAGQLQYPRYKWNWYLSKFGIHVIMYAVFMQWNWGTLQAVVEQVHPNNSKVRETRNAQPAHICIQHKLANVTHSWLLG
jgi:hypothetical protein